jgi:hypothetical protein
MLWLPPYLVSEIMSGFELSELPYQGLAIHFRNNLISQPYVFFEMTYKNDANRMKYLNFSHLGQFCHPRDKQSSSLSYQPLIVSYTP